MLFNFKSHIESLLADEKKREIVERYYESLPNDKGKLLKEHTFFIKYYQNFIFEEDFPIHVPPQFQYDFDWSLLLQLVCGSFSSNAKFERFNLQDNLRYKLLIEVENDGVVIKKYLHELKPFQIDRLFGIYIEEAMNLENHWQKNAENERVEIKKEQEIRLLYYKAFIAEHKEFTALF